MVSNCLRDQGQVLMGGELHHLRGMPAGAFIPSYGVSLSLTFPLRGQEAVAVSPSAHRAWEPPPQAWMMIMVMVQREGRHVCVCVCVLTHACGRR